MSGNGQATEGCHGLLVTRTLTTVRPFRCDDAAIAYTEMVKTSTPGLQVDGGERCPTACDWSSIVGSKDRKASAPNQTESHVEQVAMDNESEGVYVRVVMENLPTLAR